MKLDLQTYNLRDDWKVAIEHLDFIARFKDEEWWQKRPVPYEWQENWVLAMLYQGVTDPASHPACDVYCPQWPKVIDALWETGHVEHGTLTLKFIPPPGEVCSCSPKGHRAAYRILDTGQCAC
ncbi:MAG TPA: hypothetical protein VNA24_30595 [Hyalangium sp.]|nr:hypothetical protein [Hyalangium sp.]